MKTSLTSHLVRVPLVLACLIALIALCGPVQPAAAQTGPSQQQLFEQQLVAFINQLRATGAAGPNNRLYPACPPLTVDSRLAQAARGHAADMAANDYLSYTSPDGRSQWDRIQAAGYAYSTAGEAVTAGSATADAAFSALKANPAHLALIMNCRFIHVGVGYAYNPAARFDHYWTVDLAQPR